MKKIRLIVLLTVTYVRTHWLLFGVGLTLGIALLVFFPKLTSKPKVAIIGLAGDYTVSTLPLEVQNEISFGLTRVLPDGKIVPAAAKSWEFSDSAKSLTFTLDDLAWQDASKFDAASVNYNLKSVQLARPAENQIKLTLKESFSPILTIVSQPLFKSGLVGLGDWRVSAVSFNGKFVSSLTLDHRQTGDRKIYKFFPNEQTVILALKLGSINQAAGLHLTTQIEKDDHYVTRQRLDTATVATLFFNLDNDLLADKSVRQGLTYALPDNFPAGTPANAPLPKDSWYESQQVKKYPQNVDLAKKLLAKSASESAKNKIILSTTRPLEETAKDIAKIWESLGINTTVEVVDIPAPTYDVFLAYLELPPDPDQYLLWHSTQQTNLSQYKSPKVDKLLEEGRRAQDPKERKEIYSNFQKALTEDVPAAFLFYPYLYTITRK